MAVRSKRLFGPTTVTTAVTTVFTCPAGYTAVIKNLSLVSAGAIAGDFLLYINGTTAVKLLLKVNVGGGNAVNLAGIFVVLAGGDTLHCTAPAANSTITASGALLFGIA